MLSSFAQKVKAFIAENQLLKSESTYLLALSGGCDSVALLRIMIEFIVTFNLEMPNQSAMKCFVKNSVGH